MSKNTTIDTVLRDYYLAVDSKKLSEDNIVINEELEIPDSSEKYIIELAKFLNEAYYKGYIISDSILKRLMDIIDYEGYEYQILQSYISILNDSMKDYLGEEVKGKPDFDRLELTVQNCINFTTKYAEAISEIPITSKIVENAENIPHFKEPGVDEESFSICVLSSIENPIVLIHKDIIENKSSLDKFIDCLYIIYKNKPEFFYGMLLYNNSIRSRAISTGTLFFLLDNDDIKGIDILTDFTSSINDLKILIESYYKYNEIEGQLPMSVSKNIGRLLNLITRNLPIEMVAFIIGKDYEFWRKVWSDTHCIPEVLNSALNVYFNSNGALEYRDHLDCIMNLLEFDNTSYDIYFYARYFVLNMDYQILCDNFIKIFTELYKYLTIGECYELIDEFISALFNLENASVDNRLVELSKYLDEVTREEFIDPILKYTCDTINSYIEK